MTEEQFKELVQKFLTGEIDDNELDQLMILMRSNPDLRKRFDKENEIWQLTNPVLNNTIEESWNGITGKIYKDDEKPDLILISKTKLSAVIVAAGLIFLIGIGSLFLKQDESLKEGLADANIEIKTDEGEKARVLMSDSTIIILNSGSRLKYNNTYNEENRTVDLSGEAYFDVHSNSEKPFVVQLDSVYITATGTSFNVYSYGNDKRIEATLEEGQIYLTSIYDKKTVHVKPGQQAVYTSGKATVKNVNTETYTSWKENKLRLIDTPMEEALLKIARRYKVVFEIHGSDILDLKYTATFIDESIEDVMQMLEKVSPISYEIHNRTSINDKEYIKPRIVISSRKNTQRKK